MDMDSVAKHKEMVDSQSLIYTTLLACIKPMALKCAVDLGVADAIHKHGRPMSIPQLAEKLSLPPAKAPCLARLLRLLEHLGFFESESDEKRERSYGLTPASRSLVADGGSRFVRLILHRAMLSPWSELSAWFLDDGAKTAFHIANKMSLWEYAGSDPQFNATFNDAMAYDSEMVTNLIVERCGEVFDGVGTLVDVGGGKGSVARAITEAFPRMKCTVYDLPHVVGPLHSSERVEYVGGNMFEYVPPADAVLLKWVLHDYDDENCLRILKQCKKAIEMKEKKGKVIVVDMVLNVTRDDESKPIEMQILIDLQMMVLLGGKERDEHEWQQIFDQAGFSDYKIIPLNYLSLIELYL